MKKTQVELQFNPFVSSVMGNPWKSTAVPDVRSINERTFGGLLSLINNIPHCPELAAVVIGETGYGKTHFIKRLITEPNLVFVYVHPLKDPHSCCASLLEAAVLNLCAPPPGLPRRGKWTRLDLMIAHVLKNTMLHYAEQNRNRVDQKTKDVLQKIKNDPLLLLTLKNPDKWSRVLEATKELLLNSGFPLDDVSEMVLHALFQYVDESKRKTVRTMLSGYIPEDADCQSLGIKFREGEFSIGAQENRALKILRAIGILLNHYCPMIICFDQLDNLTTPEQVEAFGSLINFIVNETLNILPVAFIRPGLLTKDTWANCLDKAANERLQSHKFFLESLDLEDKIEIVRQRLIWAGGGFQNEIDSLLSSCKREIEKVLLSDEASPRQVIRTANSLVEKLHYPAPLNLVEVAIKQGTGPVSSPVEHPSDVLRVFFEEEREKIIYNKNVEPIRKETIIEALHLYFANRGPATPYQVTKLAEDAKIGLTIKIQSSGPGSAPKTIDFLMETTVNGTSLIGAFKRLRSRITAGTATCSFFLRDSRAQIPTKPGGMPKTVAERDEFLKAGGAVG
ncbi:MAG: hypothetical protein HQK60_18615 [Deltaproteobacteria bacterium]|nr:hypothetical protein [Deltaproteobacteria bacterium]